MSEGLGIRTISFDEPNEIVNAIRNRETFEVGGCHGRMPEAVLFMERAIGSEGLTSSVCTKGWPGSLIPTFHALDYEIMKRPVDKALRISYVKAPSLAERISETASAVGQGIAETAEKTASLASDAATSVKGSITAAAEETTAFASGVANATASAWDQHIPSKEMVVGTALLGVAAPFVIGKEGVEAVGAKAISTVSDVASDAASAVSEAAGTAVSAVKEHPFATAAGVVIGVGAVAAAPFTGGGSVLGAASLASSLAGAGGIAAAAGVAGAGVGAAASSAASKKDKSSAYNDGVEKGKAESAIKIKELSRMLENAAAIYASQKRLNEFIVCLVASGLSIASCDGAVSAEESSCIDEFAIGISKIALPQDIRDRLAEIAATPPDFNGAILYIEKFGQEIWLPIDGILSVISQADGDANQQEKEFLLKWESYKISQVQKGYIQ